MATPANPYDKLPGRGLRRAVFAVSATRCRLWLAADHLLAVDYTVASEEYRRFYFRDIEAFIIRRTAHRQLWNWIFAALLLLTAGPFALGWRSTGNGGLLVTALILAALWLLAIVINSARGPTCETHIRTAVQTEQLPSLSRLSVARRVLALIQPLIVEVQGAATPEELAEVPWMAAEAPRAPGAAAPRPIRTEKGWLHGALFALLLIEAGLTAIAFLVFGEPLTTFSMLAMLTGCVVCVTALMRQAGTDLPWVVRHVAKWAVAYYFLKCAAGFVFMMIFAIRNPGIPLVTGLEMIGEPGFATASLLSVCIATVIGFAGLIPLLAHLRRRSAAVAA